MNETAQQKPDRLTKAVPWIALIVACAAAAGTLITAFTNVQNRSDIQAGQTKAEFQKEVGDLAVNATTPILKEINEKLNALQASLSENNQKLAVVQRDIERTIDDVNRLEGRLTARIDRLEERVDRYSGFALRGAAADLANLPVAELEKQLDVVAVVMKEARDQRVRMNPEVPIGIQGKLRQIKSRPEPFWAAAFSLVSYETYLRSNFTVGPKNPVGTTVVASTFQNCDVQLDNLTIVDTWFLDCLIRYNGGPVQIRNSQFVNCIFLFNISGTPPPAGRRFGEALIAQNASKVVVR